MTVGTGAPASSAKPSPEPVRPVSRDGLYRDTLQVQAPMLRKKGKWYRQGLWGNRWVRHSKQKGYRSAAEYEAMLQRGEMRRLGSVAENPRPFKTTPRPLQSRNGGYVMAVSKSRVGSEDSARLHIQGNLMGFRSFGSQPRHTEQYWAWEMPRFFDIPYDLPLPNRLQLRIISPDLAPLQDPGQYPHVRDGLFRVKGDVYPPMLRKNGQWYRQALWANRWIRHTDQEGYHRAQTYEEMLRENKLAYLGSVADNPRPFKARQRLPQSQQGGFVVAVNKSSIGRMEKAKEHAFSVVRKARGHSKTVPRHTEQYWAWEFPTSKIPPIELVHRLSVRLIAPR